MGEAIHATAVVVGEQGVLICGPSGAGKSTLAQALVADARRQGRFAALIGDDRVLLSVRGGRLIVRPHPAIAGMIEVRGQGIIAVPHEAAAAVALAVELTTKVERLPADSHIILCGIAIRRIFMGLQPNDGAGVVLSALAAITSAA